MRALCCVLLACAVNGVWAGPSAPELPVLRMPPESQRQAWPSGLRLNGIPVAVQIYEWPIALADAVDWMVDQFDAELLLRPHRGGWLMSPRDEPAWVLTLAELASGRTLVTLSAWNSGGAAAGVHTRATPDWLPPGGKLRLDIGQDDGELGSAIDIAIYTYEGFGPEALARELERGLSLRGWRRRHAQSFSSWRHDGVRVDFVVVAQAGGSALFVQQDSQQPGSPKLGERRQ